MSLANTYYQNLGRLPEFFNQIKDAQAPDQLTQKLLKDWGFSSTNDRALIPLLKALGFLSADGKPTGRYKEYRDHSQSESILGDALKEAYSDIFLIKQYPTSSDKKAIQGKFKSYHNGSDLVAGHMTKTFLALLNLADLNVTNKPKNSDEEDSNNNEIIDVVEDKNKQESGFISGLHYNVQIHLPATKDVEVYNAIFKSIKEHLIE